MRAWSASVDRPHRLIGSAGLLLGLLGALFTLNVLMHFPGKLNSDSVSQYAQAVAGQYSDWHPPIMAWLWGRLRVFGDGPAPFLVLHLAAYWAGFGLLADALRRIGHPRLGLLMLASGAFPLSLYLNGIVMKDVGMVAAWLSAIGLVFWFRVQQRKIPAAWLVVIAVLMIYGTMVRGNALFALGPVLVFMLSASPAWMRTTSLMIAAVVVAVLALPVLQLSNRVLFDAAPRSWVHALYLYDLMGIAKHQQNPALLAPRANFTAQDLQDCYTPYWFDSLSPWGRCASRLNRPDPNFITDGDGVTLQWLKTIAAHPVSYAIHRLKHFNSALLFVVPLKHIRFTPEYLRPGEGLVAEVVTERDIKMDLLRKPPFSWPIVWLVWSVPLLIFLSRLRGEPSVYLARALSVSALGYSSAYLLIGVATDIRFHYWTILALMIANIAVLPQLVQGFRHRSAVLWSGFSAVVLVTVIGIAARLLDFKAWVI